MWHPRAWLHALVSGTTAFKMPRLVRCASSLVLVVVVLLGCMATSCAAASCPSNPLASSTIPSAFPSSMSSIIDPDVVGFVPIAQTLPSGSLLIPMDQNYQSYVDGLNNQRFNFNCYGHVIKLLHAGIPCKWIIATRKLKDQADLVNVPSQQVLPTAGGPSTNVTLYSGPIAITQQYSATALALLKQFNLALSSVLNSTNTNPITVLMTTADITITVRHELTTKPYIGVSNVGDRGAVALGYMNIASLSEVTHYETFNDMTVLKSIGPSTCYTLIVLIDLLNSNMSYAQAARNYLSSGGNLFAQSSGTKISHLSTVLHISCSLSLSLTRYGSYLSSVEQPTNMPVCARALAHGWLAKAIETMENYGVSFISTHGIQPQISAIAATSYAPDLPVAQFLSSISSETFTSIVSFMQPRASKSSTWSEYDACIVCSTEADIQQRTARAMVAKLPYASGAPGGVFVSLGGHDWLNATGTTGWPSTLDISTDNAARLFFNAALLPATRSDSCVLANPDPSIDVSVAATIALQSQPLPFMITVSNSGATAQGVELTVELDPSFEYQSIGVSPADSIACSLSGLSLTCSGFGTASGGVYNLVDGQSYSVQLIVAPAQVGVAGIRASITSSSVDMNEANNVACQTLNICNQPLGVSLEVSHAGSTSVSIGSSVQFSATLFNLENLPITDQIVLQLRPIGLSVSGLTTSASSSSMSSLTWSIQNVGAQSIAQLFVSGFVTQSAPASLVTLEICFTQASRYPSSLCQQAQPVYTLTFSVTETLLSPVVRQGSTALLRLTASNGDPTAELDNVLVFDLAPAGFDPPSILSAYIYDMTASPLITLSADTPPTSSWNWLTSGVITNTNSVTYSMANGMSIVGITLGTPVFRLSSATVSLLVSTSAPLVNFGIGVYYYSSSNSAWLPLATISATDTTLNNRPLEASIPVADLVDNLPSFLMITTFGDPISPTGSFVVSNVTLTLSPIALLQTLTMSTTCAAMTCSFFPLVRLPATSSLEITLAYPVSSTAQVGTVSNIAWATSSFLSSANTTIKFPVQPLTDLTISISPPQAQVYLLDAVIFTITVAVSGTTAATGVQVSVPNINLNSLTQTNLTATINGADQSVSSLSAILLSPVTVTPGAPLVIAVTFQAMNIDTVIATVTATSSNMQSPSSTFTTTILSPVAFTLSAASPITNAGGTVSYSMIVQNSRPLLASPVSYSIVEAIDSPPANLSLTVVSPTCIKKSPTSSMLLADFPIGSPVSFWGSSYTASGSVVFTQGTPGNLLLQSMSSITWPYTFSSMAGTIAYTSVIMSYKVQRSVNGAIQLSVTTASTPSVYLSTLPSADLADSGYTTLDNIDITPWVLPDSPMTFGFMNTGTSSTTVTSIAVTISMVSSSVGPSQIVLGGVLTVQSATLLNQESIECSFTGSVSNNPITTVISNTAAFTDTAEYTFRSTVDVSIIEANDDFVSVIEGTQMLIPVTANDLGGAAINPTSLTVSIASAHGSTLVNSFGSISYKPNSLYVGADSFQYRIQDWAASTSSTATVHLVVDAQVQSTDDSVYITVNSPWLETVSTIFANDRNINTASPGSSYTLTITQPTVSRGPIPVCNVTLGAIPTISCTPSSQPYTLEYTVCNQPIYPQSLQWGYSNCGTATIAVSLHYPVPNPTCTIFALEQHSVRWNANTDHSFSFYMTNPAVLGRLISGWRNHDRNARGIRSQLWPGNDRFPSRTEWPDLGSRLQCRVPLVLGGSHIQRHMYCRLGR